MADLHQGRLLQRVVEALRSNRFTFGDEDELQRGIDLALHGAGLTADREVRLSSTDRPDFMVEGVAIEVKVDGTANALIRQLARYALHPSVIAIVVVTNRARLTAMPEAINMKPVHVVSLLAGGL